MTEITDLPTPEAAAVLAAATKITRESFTAAITAAVAERGADFTFPKNTDPIALAQGWTTANGTCKYAKHDGTPACIVGLALYKIDPLLLTTVSDRACSSDGVFDIFETDDRVLRLAARDAQLAQDRGHSWGVALNRYLNVLQVGVNEEARIAAAAAVQNLDTRKDGE